MARIDELLNILVERGGSDLHMSSGYRPCIRIDGEMHFLKDFEPLKADDNRSILREIMPERNRVEFEKRWDTDFAYELPHAGRFRVNIFLDHNGWGGVLRLIPHIIPSLEDLNMPEAIRKFCFLSKGIVILTGPTGSGKSTTLAAMTDLINRSRREHIITIEDPVEFLHKSKGCLINQREVNTHTQSFANALRAALREDPDIVLLGEMRDLETIETAIETAETGHLVFGTLHTNTAATTVDRMIDKFPSDRQNQIRSMLSDTLKGVVAQTLCKRIGGGRIASTEILVVTPAVAANIREGKTHQIPSAMQTSKKEGMQLFGESLLQYVKDGIITSHEAYMKAIDKEYLVKKFEESGITVDMTLREVAITVAPDEQVTDQEDHDLEEQLNNCQAKLSKNPEDTETLKDLAWIRAAHRNKKVRDGAEAVALARRAVDLTGGKDPMALIVLAAACAELEQFDEAQESARRALKSAKAAKRKDLIPDIQEHITIYKKHLPLRAE